MRKFILIGALAVSIGSPKHLQVPRRIARAWLGSHDSVEYPARGGAGKGFLAREGLWATI